MKQALLDIEFLKTKFVDHDAKLDTLFNTSKDIQTRMQEMAARPPSPDAWSTGAQSPGTTTMPGGTFNNNAAAQQVDGACIYWTLPITYGPLGMLGNVQSMFKMFDDKLPSQNSEFKFNGNNQGKG